MPLCKFFMQGHCRFGNKCWNEHPSGGNQGFSVTAQRQLFGKKTGGGGGGGGGQQNVSFRDSFGQNQNPYRWVAPDQQQQQQQGRNTQITIQQMSPAEIVKGLAGEITTTWEGGKMWPFSCLGFEKDLPSLPGFEDISPEEMRHEAYEALKQGNIQAYIQKVETAFNQVNVQRQEIKNPNMSLKQKLISFIEDCIRKKDSGNAHASLFSDSSSSTNPFGGDGGLFGISNNNQTGSGLFGTPSGFGQQTGTQSVFGQTGPETSTTGQTGTLFGKSTFGQTEQSNVFGQNTFGQAQPAAPTGLFGQPSVATGQAQPAARTGLFGQPSVATGQAQPAAPTGLFGQPSVATGQSQPAGQTGLFGKPSTSTGAFGQEAPNTPKQSLFGQSVSSPFSAGSSTPFGQSSAQPKSLFGSTVTAVAPEAVSTQPAPVAPVQPTSNQPEQISSLYTPIDKLSPQELELFKAPMFALGSIPTKPPPKELCF